MVRHFFKIWNTNLRNAACWAAFFIFCLSCSKPHAGKVYLLGESRVVSGLLAAQQGLDLKTVKISLIDEQGQRTPPFELKYDGAQGSFSFQLRDSDLYDTKKASALDRILSMGNALPSVIGIGADLVAKVDKYARLEIMPSSLSNTDYQAVPYFQGVLPLSRRNLMTGKDVIGIGGNVKFAKAGFVRIKVVDEAGIPLQGIKVAGVSQEVADGLVRADFALWHNPLLRPVLETTDATGQAFIGPIDAEFDLTRYQIFATGNGYCTYLSNPMNNFSLSEKIQPVVTLRTCAKDESSVNDLVVSFPEKLKYLEIDKRKVVHTKEDFITLRLDSRTENLRGVKIAMYETDSNYQPSLEVTGKVIDAPTFQGEFVLELPKLFKTGGTEGKFIIKVSRLAGSRKGIETSAQDFPELIVYGHRKIFTPSRETLMKTVSTEVQISLRDAAKVRDEDGVEVDVTEVDFWSNFRIASVSGVTNIVPGLAGGKFTMSSSFCGLGDSLGFAVTLYGLSTPVFKDCVNGVATFTSEEAGLVNNPKVQTTGARQPWKIFIKDKFGNVSESLEDPDAPTPKRLNVMTVIVDTSAPIAGDDPTDRLTLSDLEFFKGTDKLNTSKWLRPADVEDESISLAFLKETGTSNHNTCLQATPDSGEQNRNGGSGGNATLLGGFDHFVFMDEFGRLNIKSTSSASYKDVGLMIYKWIIGGTGSAVTSAAEESFTRCRTFSEGETDPVQPVERALKASDIVFPNDPSAEAEFFMRYMDVAGQLSSAVRYAIPACPPPGGSSLCWKADAW